MVLCSCFSLSRELLFRLKSNRKSAILSCMQQDLQRQCIELAVASGKKYCHPDTRFITLQNTSLEGFIPLYENFLYALTLLRSKTQENILEARALLERLFYFQHPDAFGNFPLFIHEFPHARDHMQAVRILTVLVWIQRDFTAVLGTAWL